METAPAGARGDGMVRGIHHISMQCDGAQDLERARALYCGALGLSVARQWPEGMMLDTGAGLIEIFCNAPGEARKGAIRHFALAVDDVDACAEAVRAAGYDVFIPPKELMLASQPVYRARIAFCVGPLGEEIELFMERPREDKT